VELQFLQGHPFGVDEHANMQLHLQLEQLRATVSLHSFLIDAWRAHK